MTKLSVVPFASAAAEMSRQGSPVKGRTLLYFSVTCIFLLLFLSLYSFLQFSGHCLGLEEYCFILERDPSLHLFLFSSSYSITPFALLFNFSKLFQAF